MSKLNSMKLVHLNETERSLVMFLIMSLLSPAGAYPKCLPLKCPVKYIFAPTSLWALCVFSLQHTPPLFSAVVYLSTEQGRTSWKITAIRPLSVRAFDIYFWWSALCMFFVWSEQSLPVAASSLEIEPVVCLSDIDRKTVMAFSCQFYPPSASLLMNILAVTDRRTIWGPLFCASPHQQLSHNSREQTSFN